MITLYNHEFKIISHPGVPNILYATSPQEGRIFFLGKVSASLLAKEFSLSDSQALHVMRELFKEYYS